MFPEDQKRIQREIDIWMFTRGPDNSEYERVRKLILGEMAKGRAGYEESLRRKHLAMQLGEIGEF